MYNASKPSTPKRKAKDLLMMVMIILSTKIIEKYPSVAMVTDELEEEEEEENYDAAYILFAIVFFTFNATGPGVRFFILMCFFFY